VAHMVKAALVIMVILLGGCTLTKGVQSDAPHKDYAGANARRRYYNSPAYKNGRTR